MHSRFAAGQNQGDDASHVIAISHADLVPKDSTFTGEEERLEDSDLIKDRRTKKRALFFVSEDIWEEDEQDPRRKWESGTVERRLDDDGIVEERVDGVGW